MIGESLLHYEILEKIGEGGMGVVYLARDSRLGRTVALKVLPPGHASEPKRRQRFLREARAAASLNHPNIVALYDIGTERNTDFIAMEYVPGESLQAKMRHGRLPVSNVVSYALQIGGALARAHAAGVVHRDLKPGNVMITPDGEVKLLDFGLAQLSRQQTPSEAESEKTETLSNISEIGTVQGTVAYMSPEQAKGEPVDLRSDVFSFGVMLYEMLSGTRPFQGANTILVLHSIAFQEPVAIQKLREDAPPALVDIVRRCMYKDREQRFSTMDPILSDLRVLSGAQTSSGAVPLIVTPARSRRGWLFGAGGALIAAGAMFAAWTFSHRGPVADNADAPELIRRGHALLHRYDKAENKDQARQAFQRAVELDPNSAAAYAGLADAYCLLHASNPDNQLLVVASANAARALELNPLLSAAHESMGLVYFEQGKLQEAERESRRALELDPGNADAQISLGEGLQHQNRNKEAEEVFRGLIASHPDDWRGYLYLGSMLMGAGRSQESVAVLQKAGELVKDNVTVYRLLGLAHQKLGRDTDAIAAFQKALAVRPTASVYAAVGGIYYYGGRYADAAAAFERAVKLSANDNLHWSNLGDVYRFLPGSEAKSKEAYGEAIRIIGDRLRKTPGDSPLRSRLAMYLAKSGQSDAAREELKKIPPNASLDPNSLYAVAMAYQFLGDSSAEIRYLAQAVKAGYSAAELAADPDLIALRRDPRYHLEVLANAK